MATIAGTLGVLHQSVQPPAGDTLADLFGIYDALALLDTPAGCCKHGCRRRFALFNLSTELVTRAACLWRAGHARSPRCVALIFSEPDFLLLVEPTNPRSMQKV